MPNPNLTIRHFFVAGKVHVAAMATITLACVADCSGHGSCYNGTCVCDAGYQGVGCADLQEVSARTWATVGSRGAGFGRRRSKFDTESRFASKVVLSDSHTNLKRD